MRSAMDLVGDPPQLLGRGGPFAQRRDQRFRAREQSFPIERRHWLSAGSYSAAACCTTLCRACGGL